MVIHVPCLLVIRHSPHKLLGSGDTYIYMPLEHDPSWTDGKWTLPEIDELRKMLLHVYIILLHFAMNTAKAKLSMERKMVYNFSSLVLSHSLFSSSKPCTIPLRYGERQCFRILQCSHA
ncbi:unnamed protein product [Orchesella dallaii]|uniref:Uncharacterized protein n=1 Tax=Orchesella dallaii TaxID=48710 RepID=A0ABP1PVB9_9HEXA